MKALVITGPLGAGKTTTLVELLATLKSFEGVHMVINEVGAFATDIDRVNQATGGKLDVSGLTAGCLGCANLAEFKEIVERLADQNGLLFIEPTGVADGHEIQAVLEEYGIDWRCLTLVNPVTFDHDMLTGILPTQLEVATRIGITRSDQLSEPEQDQLLLALAPYSVPVTDMPLGDIGQLTVNTLLASSPRVTHHGHNHDHDHHDHSHCDHDHASHDHHDHDHHHHGGYITTPVKLRTDVTTEQLRDVCMQLRTRRAKGVVDGKWFDCVGGEFSIGEYRSEEPYAIFIDTRPLPDGIVLELATAKPHANHSLKERLAGLSQDQAHTEIDRLLAQAGGPLDSSGGLRLTDESIDLAFTIAKASGSDSDRQKAIRARIRHTLAVYDLMPDWTGANPSQIIEVGAILAWQTAMRTDEIGKALVDEVRRRRPASMWLTGLDQIATDSPPRYDLFDTNYSGPFSPAAAKVIAQWGITHEGLEPEQLREVFSQMAKSTQPYPVWSDQWRHAAKELQR